MNLPVGPPQASLEEDVPGAAMLVEAAVAQERALQDARSERVLQMLRSKVGSRSRAPQNGGWDSCQLVRTHPCGKGGLLCLANPCSVLQKGGKK